MLEKLKDPSIVKTCSYIDGQWITSGKATYPVLSPFSGETIADVDDICEEKAMLAVEAASLAFTSWSKTTGKQRQEHMMNWRAAMLEHWEDLATLISLETGKPWEQAEHELMGSEGFLAWYGEEAKRIMGYTVQSPDPTRRMSTIYQPVGPILAITPWNFPLVLILQKCAAAIAAGCTVVVKPAEDTPLSALALAFLADKAGLPKGVFNVVAPKNPEKVCHSILSSHKLRKVSFTGSTSVGSLIMAQAAKNILNTGLELGGNCPAIIAADADIEKAALTTFWFKFYNAGQCCNNINRFLVDKKVTKQFVSEFKKLIETHIKLGSGLDKNNNLGPMINEQGVQKVEALLKDAVSKGAKILTGGKRVKNGSLLFEPTLITNANHNMELSQTEVFGPVAVIYEVDGINEALTLGNQTQYGLAAYVFSKDYSTLVQSGEALEAGAIGMNTCDVCSELLPFGGWKQSGIGREHRASGSLKPYLEEKAMVLGQI